MSEAKEVFEQILQFLGVMNMGYDERLTLDKHVIPRIKYLCDLANYDFGKKNIEKFMIP